MADEEFNECSWKASKHFSCHNVFVQVTKCPFSHPHLIPSWQPPPSHLLVAGLGRALGPAHITACHLAAREEVGAQSPDPGTLCCLPQSWEGRPARAGHSQPQHSDRHFSNLPMFPLFASGGFQGLNSQRHLCEVFLVMSPHIQPWPRWLPWPVGGGGSETWRSLDGCSLHSVGQRLMANSWVEPTK